MTQAQLENGITLEYEIHGDPSHPTILIILGITDNITDWPPGLYESLVSSGFCVVRYELRDSGLSTKLEEAGYPDLHSAKAELDAGHLPEAEYTVHDVADDAILLMDYLNIKSACVVGYSYGSMVAQLLALKASKKVTALICLQGSNYNPSLPNRTKSVEKAMIAATVEYPTQGGRVEAMKNLRLATNGSVHAMDDDEATSSATQSVSRMYYPQGTARIILSRFAIPPFYQQTENITCPALILHADQDPIFSIEHGEDMAERIPNSTLLILEGAGHNHPLSLQPLIVNSIREFAVNAFKSQR